MSVESAVANFLPLGALLEGKELTIANPVPDSNDYDETYYIGRTLRHGKDIKREIFVIKMLKNSAISWLVQNKNTNNTVSNTQTAICIG